MYRILLSLLAIIILAGCQTNNDEAGYKLDASVKQEGEAYMLIVSTNLNFSEVNYGRSHVEGEGHIHLHVNGRLIGPIMSTEPYELKNLNPGTNNIKLVMSANNHDTSKYAVSKELTVEVK